MAKYSKDGQTHYRKLKRDTVIEVTNLKEKITQKFLVDDAYLLWFIPCRVLYEISIGAALCGDFYFLSQLKGKEIEWRILEKEKINISELKTNDKRRESERK